MGVALHDVENAEAFCSRVLSAYLDRRGAHLTLWQREDLFGFMLLTAVETAAVFQPGKVTFVRFLGYRLDQRIPDWYRREFGDSRARTPRPGLVPLDAGPDEEGPTPAALTVPSHEDEVLTRVALASW